jgi:hypothetical protein
MSLLQPWLSHSECRSRRICDPLATTADDLVATWSGNNDHQVQFSFNSDGPFVKDDLIALCPEDVVCVWSGIVTSIGTYKYDNEAVSLSYDIEKSGFDVTTPRRWTSTGARPSNSS